jgi:hypothetical protein
MADRNASGFCAHARRPCTAWRNPATPAAAVRSGAPDGLPAVRFLKFENPVKVGFVSVSQI